MPVLKKGSFIGWKKAKNYIIKLEVLADAKRSSATGRKCRCDKAKVVAIEEKMVQKAILQKLTQIMIRLSSIELEK